MAYFSRESSGIFIPNGKAFKEFKGDIGNGSINGIIEAMGYNKDEAYSYLCPSNDNEKIVNVIFEIFTRNIIFLNTDKKHTFVTEKDVAKALREFSVVKQYESITARDLLTQGIENETLSIEFLSEVFKIKNPSPNGMFYAEHFKIYLYFTDGFLTNYQYDDGLFPWAKHLKQVNSTVYGAIEETANQYWKNDLFQIQKEINLQCEGWGSVPGARGNEFTKYHLQPNGSVNFHMIRVCHYSLPISESQFMEINHGRYSEAVESSNDESKCYKCGMFKYIFSNEGDLLNVHIIE